MPAFSTQIRVRFDDIDHAGIVFYPRFLVYFHHAFETLFDEVGPSYASVLDGRRLGFPTVHIETDFSAPLRYGDFLSVEVTTGAIGRSSSTLIYRGRRCSDGVKVCEARVTTACVDLDDFTTRPIPDDIRALFERYRESGT
jgi:4-hydroxybenzoyl-CoA thioesterase